MEDFEFEDDSDNAVSNVLKERLRLLEGHEVNVQATLSEVRKEIRDLKRAMKLLGINTEYRARAPRKNKSTTEKGHGGVNLNSASANKIRDVMVAKMSAEHTCGTIQDSSGLNQSQVNKILVAMRDAGEIDLVRLGGRTGTTKFYKYHGR